MDMRQINNLMRQAQQMQENLKKNQEQMQTQEFEGSAGGGLVKIKVTGGMAARKVEIDRKLMADDPEMAEDLVIAAFNDALNKAQAAQAALAQSAAGGLNLPPGFKMPF
jgi:nucleoid-associated protein EbfC